jgi:hypothetical protein
MSDPRPPAGSPADDRYFILAPIGCKKGARDDAAAPHIQLHNHGRTAMAKGRQQHKAIKKKPAKTLMEKRAAKAAKKGR